MEAYLKWRAENPDAESDGPGAKGNDEAGELEEDESEEADDYDDEDDDDWANSISQKNSRTDWRHEIQNKCKNEWKI